MFYLFLDKIWWKVTLKIISSKYRKLHISLYIFQTVTTILLEALPRLDNYRSSKRNLKRKSIGELHGEPVINLPVSNLSI
uniref:Uncharacterized protein n=1 Tax=Megaselia scalaris TaxID=36166 RepID=T1GUF4_MEGSC